MGDQISFSFDFLYPVSNESGQTKPLSLRIMNVNIAACADIGYLKVPKREIVDHSDFHDFYAIKSLTVSDFRVKIKICLKNI